MMQSYFRTFIRNLQKNKLYAVVNMVGMSIAFACCILLLSFIYSERSFDKFHKDPDRIFKIYTKVKTQQGDDLSSSLPYPITQAVKKENTGIKYATPFFTGGFGIRCAGKAFNDFITMVDQDFFTIFSYPIVEGNRQQPLGQADDIVLSKQLSKKLFCNENPIGKKVEIYTGGSWKQLTVSSIIDNKENNSTLQFSALARTEIMADFSKMATNWDNQNLDVYVKAAPVNTPGQIENQLRILKKKYWSADSAYMRMIGRIPDANGDFQTLHLLPLKELHFNTEIYSGKSISKSYLNMLLVIGILILLIAGSNFVNLNVGQSFTRTREMGIRKCLGANKLEIWKQNFGEGFFMILASLLLAIFISVILFKKFSIAFQSTANYSILYAPLVVISVLFILLVFSFFSSGYPAYLLSRLRTIEVLKGKVTLGKRAGLRNSLIIIQFAIAIILICSTIIIYQQFKHLKNAPLGYNTSSLISVNIPHGEKSMKMASGMRRLLQSQPSIMGITALMTNIGTGKDGVNNQLGFGFTYKDKAINTGYIETDYDFLKTLGVKLISGRDFSEANKTDSSEAVIINESLARQFQFANPIDQVFTTDSVSKYKIIGVVPDFHLYSMHQETGPLMMKVGNGLHYLLIRVRSENLVQSMNIVKQAYNQLAPGTEFMGNYTDENIARWYAKEMRLSTILSMAAIIAIILSCMGLFAMSVIIINQKVKEIGVRKVLGASVSNITAMIASQFLRPVIIALIISIPVSVLLMNKWLQEFSYRIGIKWWVFVLAALITLATVIATVSFQAIKAALANPIKSLRTE